LPVTLRKATPDDASDLLAWRNDPLTRAMSRSSDAVEAADHARWFQHALQDADCTLLIGEDDGRKIGMVRLSRGEETEVSINLNPAVRGRGLSRALLTLALAQESGALLAVIKPENLASIRLFEGAGFVLKETQDGLSRYVRAAAGAAP
jgi:RimJ/RimL family protein N-acetyltransferase